jgi:methyl coenzyme M reductase subunit D
MLTLLNRKELTVTFNMNEQARVRKVLTEEGIDYTVKTVNRLSASLFSAGGRVRTGTYGQNTDTMTEYIIYVKKVDYERAMGVIHS